MSRTIILASPGGGVFLLICAAVCSVKELWKTVESRNFLNHAETAGTLAAMHQEWVQGTKLLNGKLVLGENYILGKNGIVATRYDELVQVYEYNHKTNGVTDTHQLRGKTKTDETRIICTLNKSSRSDIIIVFALLKNKNPDIQLGA